MNCKGIMNKLPVTCGPTETVERAARLMFEYHIGAIVVVDDEGQLVGIITDRDVCMAAFRSSARLADLPVSQAMATAVVTCRETDPVSRVHAVMREVGVRRVPSVDDADIPIGLVAITDIARKAAVGDDRALDRDLVDTMA